MKKIFALALALMLVMSLGATAFAAEQEVIAVPGEVTFDINGKYSATANAAKKVSVDVEYGAMQFVYTVDTKGEWNPDSHTYATADGQGQWLVDNNSNTIKVTNHSNLAITVGITGTTNVGATVNVSDAGAATLKSGDIENDTLGEPTKADSKEFTVTLTGGSMTDVQTTYSPIGSVTVNITEAVGP